MASEYTPASLESLLKTLSISPDEPDHEAILKHANNILKSQKSHPRAIHTKAVALLQLDRYEDVLRLLDSPEGKKLGDLVALERAYALYKRGKSTEAVEIAQKAVASERNGRGLKHVEAQSAYRLEKFDRTAELYKQLADGQNEVVSEDYDLRVNTGATDAQLVWSGRGDLVTSKTSREAMDAFETAFNAACLSVAKNEIGQAFVLLKRAKELCNALEDLSEEEKKAEIAPILAQEVYVLSRLGRFEEAAERSKELDVPSLSDISLKLISLNNDISAASRLPGYNPHISLCLSAATAKASSGSPSSRPFDFQSRILKRNEAVLDLHVSKTESVKSQAIGYQKTYPEDNVISVINAAAYSENKTSQEGLKKIEALLETSPKDIGLALTVVQLRMGTGNITGAIEVLEKLLTSLDETQRYQPGLVGLLVAFYQHQGRKQHVRDVLSKASDWWKQSSKPNAAVLCAAGKAKLDSDNESDLKYAGELFTSLLSMNPSDKLAVAGLVASYSTIDPSVASKYVDTLTPVSTLISGIDAAALESLGVAQPPRKRGREEDVVPVVKPKKAKKKKPRLPKDFDPNKTVDPERWLPLKDRSSYRPKGKKDKKRAAGLTQGGNVAESTEIVGGGGEKTEVKKAGGGGGGGGGAQKKKKKKGGKW